MLLFYDLIVSLSMKKIITKTITKEGGREKIKEEKGNNMVY